jgi:hypothetical protein
MAAEDKKNQHERTDSAEATSSDERIEGLLRELRPVELPPFYTERLQARVQAASAGTSWAERLRSPQLAWAVAGACVVALTVIILNIDRGAPSSIPATSGMNIAHAGIDPVTPADNSVVGAGDVEIVAAIYPPIEQGIVRLYVDETDVTGLAEVTGSYVMYSPTEKFEEGEHIVTIEIQDGSGNILRNVSWLFYTLNGERASLDERV